MKSKVEFGERWRAFVAMILIFVAIFLLHRFSESKTSGSVLQNTTISESPIPNSLRTSTGAIPRKKPDWLSSYEDLPTYRLVDRISELESELEEEQWARLEVEERNHDMSEELERLNSDLSDVKFLSDGWSCEELRDAISGIEEASVTY